MSETWFIGDQRGSKIKIPSVEKLAQNLPEAFIPIQTDVFLFSYVTAQVLMSIFSNSLE